MQQMKINKINDDMINLVSKFSSLGFPWRNYLQEC